MDSQDIKIDADRPLTSNQALKLDQLDRSGFAQAVVAALGNISSTSGFIVSVEGAWGSGKTSVLAMIEELLNKQEKRPVIVQFNPWLVGDRDALLRVFLNKLAAAVSLKDHAKHGREAAKAITAYATLFDVAKLIPGVEPWATLLKSVVSTVGKTAGDVAEHGTPDIETQKVKVEAELRKLPKPIIVFIDDIDRLFPLEVVEMIRIIKAVGDLPNVGYVLAWDPKYIDDALASASVPHSSSYLDKIVQVRMPLPRLSPSAKEALIDTAIGRLQSDVLTDHFPNQRDRFSSLYFSGLRDLLEQPRDVARVFNTVGVIEPALRGEIAFADIVGMAALMVKAPTIFELLQRNPRWFVGSLPGDMSLTGKPKANVKVGKAHLEDAYRKHSSPDAIQELVSFLFPQTENAENRNFLAATSPSEINGHLAAPRRLLVALQLCVSAGDVSLVAAKRYLLVPSSRPGITRELTERNCREFLERLGDMSSSIDFATIDLAETSLAIARLVDEEPVLASTQEPKFFSPSVVYLVERTVERLVIAADSRRISEIASSIVKDPDSLTMARRILARSYLKESERSTDQELRTPVEEQVILSERFALNVQAAASDNRLLKIGEPGSVLWTLARLAPQSCPQVFEATMNHDPSLDGFAMAILGSVFVSGIGQAFQVPSEPGLIDAYCPLEDLRALARRRLDDSSLEYPARAAWRSLLEEKSIYGMDGSIRER